MELSTMITGAQQQGNATATQFDSSDFIVRRPEEYERTLIVLTARIEESYTQFSIFQFPIMHSVSPPEFA